MLIDLEIECYFGKDVLQSTTCFIGEDVIIN